MQRCKRSAISSPFGKKHQRRAFANREGGSSLLILVSRNPSFMRRLVVIPENAPDLFALCLVTESRNLALRFK
jgi:hypothetical protein